MTTQPNPTPPRDPNVEEAWRLEIDRHLGQLKRDGARRGIVDVTEA